MYPAAVPTVSFSVLYPVFCVKVRHSELLNNHILDTVSSSPDKVCHNFHIDPHHQLLEGRTK